MNKPQLIARLRSALLMPDHHIIAESRHLSDNAASLDECATEDLRKEVGEL